MQFYFNVCNSQTNNTLWLIHTKLSQINLSMIQRQHSLRNTWRAY